MTLPFWTSYLLRVFSWRVILGNKGVINSALMGTGMIDEPLGFLLYNQAAVIITLSHAWAAFAILPLYVSLDKIDKSLLEASYDLGNTKFETFLFLCLGLFLFGLGESILVVSQNGVTPWTVLAEGVAKKVNIGIGLSTFLISCIVLVFWIPLKLKPGLGTIMNIIIFSITIHKNNYYIIYIGIKVLLVGAWCMSFIIVLCSSYFNLTSYSRDVETTRNTTGLFK